MSIATPVYNQLLNLLNEHSQYRAHLRVGGVQMLSHKPQPCFASKKAKKQYYDAIWFSRIRELKCRA